MDGQVALTLPFFPRKTKVQKEKDGVREYIETCAFGDGSTQQWPVPQSPVRLVVEYQGITKEESEQVRSFCERARAAKLFTCVIGDATAAELFHGIDGQHLAPSSIEEHSLC
jgi:hypothetical protein